MVLGSQCELEFRSELGQTGSLHQPRGKNSTVKRGSRILESNYIPYSEFMAVASLADTTADTIVVDTCLHNVYNSKSAPVCKLGARCDGDMSVKVYPWTLMPCYASGCC